MSANHHQSGEAPPASPPLPPVKPRERPAVRAGLFGGLLGGALGGGLGGAFGGSIEAMAPPDPAAALLGAFLGVVALTAAATPACGLAALVLGPRARSRTVLAWSAVSAFFASLVTAVDAHQAGPASAVRVFALGLPLMFVLSAALAWVRRPLWRLRWVLLAWLLLCLAGAAYGRLRPRVYAPLDPPPREPVVQLRCGPLRGGLGWVAVHYWFVAFDPGEGEWHRWELWQKADMGGTSWGHVHRDLLSPVSGVNGFPPQVMAEWRGDEALHLLAALADSPEYPDRGRYLAWPGPNSNTYIAWVLRRAGVSADLDPRGIGKDYLGAPGVALTTTRTGVQAETSLLGGKAGLLDGVEIHFLCFTSGLDTWPPALKTPLGRLGFSE
jgi:hypothetical protein